MKYDKVTEEEGQKIGVSMERSKAGTKEKRSPEGLNDSNQNTIIVNIICQYFIRDGKSNNEIQLTKCIYIYNNIP